MAFVFELIFLKIAERLQKKLSGKAIFIMFGAKRDDKIFSEVLKFVKKRNYLANIYNNYFQEVDIFQIPEVQKKSKHAFHIYPLLINFEKINLTKNILFEKMLNYNIKLQVHYIPIHLQPYYKKYYGFKKGDFPIAEKFYDREITLPIHFSLKENQVYKIVKSMKKIIL